MDNPLFQKAYADFSDELAQDLLVLDVATSVSGAGTRIEEYVGWDRNYQLTYFHGELQTIRITVPGQATKLFCR